MREHEKRQRTDVEPEAVGADRGKAQEDLPEEGAHDGQCGEINREIQGAVSGEVVEKVAFVVECQHEENRDRRDRAAENELHAEDEDVLREVWSDHAEVQQKVGKKAEKDIKEFECVKAVGQDAEKKEQHRNGKLGKEDEGVSLQQQPTHLRRKDGAKRQVAQVDGRQELE